MNKKALLIVVACAVSLSACGDMRQALTTTKATPDEFSVYTRAPLVMPPDYGVRPIPGDEENNDAITSQQTARRVLLENSRQTVVPVRSATPGTTALLTRAGVQKADPNIRQAINRETTVYAEEDRSVMDRMMFWQDPQAGTVVNADEESKRIQETQALGQAINKGETKMIEPKSKAPLEGMLDGFFN